MDERPHCHIEVETYPSRVFVRLDFARNGSGALRAGVLMLEPAIWLALRASLECWCEVEVAAVRDTMIWHPAVVEELLTVDDGDESGTPPGNIPCVVAGEVADPSRSKDRPHPDLDNLDDPSDDPIIAIDPDDDVSEPLGDAFDDIFNIDYKENDDEQQT